MEVMDLAVVGAGVSGLGAAVALADTDIDVTVYEKGSVGGRAASRTRNGCTYDSGANYLKSEDEAVNDLVRSLGYEFDYPTFREGYAAAIADYDA